MVIPLKLEMTSQVHYIIHEFEYDDDEDEPGLRSDDFTGPNGEGSRNPLIHHDQGQIKAETI